MIGKILGLGGAARDVGKAVGSVAEVFVGNRAERDAGDLERFNRALGQFGEEFSKPHTGFFDGFVNGLNRMPRPLMAIGTLVLFGYAMADPHGFALRMQGLAYVPEPLWWLLGAIVSFYFGARELHHYRGRKLDLPAPPTPRPALVADELPSPGTATELTPPAQRRSGSAFPTEPAVAHADSDAALQDRLRQKPIAHPQASKDPNYNAAVEEWRAAHA